jgi:hypothetical protein
MPVLRRSLSVTAAATALLAAASAGAQTTPPAERAPTNEPLQSVAVNPLAIPFGVFSGEYEVALPTPGFTFGVGGTHFADGSDRDTWAEAKAMYYPNERNFRSFSVGLTAGVHSARRNTTSCDFLGCNGGRRTQTAPTLGVLVSYDWLLGRQERFRVGIAAGAKRILKDVGNNDPLTQVWPDGRFVIGFVW